MTSGTLVLTRSGTLAPRPVISTAPATIGINTNFAVTSGQAAGIRRVGLVGLSDRAFRAIQDAKAA